MLDTLLGKDVPVAARCGTRALLACALALAAAPLAAQDSPLPPVTIGAGVQTSFVHNAPDGGESTDAFALNSVRLYVSGSAAPKVTFMFNTEYDGAGNHVTVLDAAAQFTFSEKANVWIGRLLPPSDRANLHGPYYSNEWAVFSDGIQDGYPFVAAGRDNGVLYWGQFDKVKLSAGAFDGASATGRTTVISAGRVQVDFWRSFRSRGASPATSAFLKRAALLPAVSSTS